MLLSHFSGLGVVWAADDLIRISLPGDPAYNPSALPATQDRAAVGYSPAFLFVGKHAWIMVAWVDRVRHNCGCGFCSRKLGACRCGAVDFFADAQPGGYWCCERGRSFHQPLRISPRVLSPRHGVSPKVEHFACAGVDFGRFS